MPSNLFAEMDHQSGIEDRRALQLAFELSMLGLSEPMSASSEPESPTGMNSFANSVPSVGLDDNRSKKSQNMTECVPVPSSEHVAEIVGRQGKDFQMHSSFPSFHYREPAIASMPRYAPHVLHY